MRISKHLLILLFIQLFFTAQGQKPKTLNTVDIYEAVQKLNVLGTVLYVAAHPDDENTRLISYMSNKLKARTAYLSLTRGDGGQNLIGPELRELLGVMRTQELLAARRIDGGEQLFTRANDFGYSKHPDETLSIWNKDSVLADVVWAIRKFRPDVIINRFNHRTPGTTHGHHTSSAMLSIEAFEMAGDPERFSKQLRYTDAWQPKRIFFNTSWWFYGSREKFREADKSNMISFDIGTYYPLKGLSNNEIASLASSQHLCQGFGRMAQRGGQEEYIEFLEGEPLKGSNDIFEGIDTSWNRIKGGERIGAILNEVERNFNFKNPKAHLPELLEAYKLLLQVENEHWKTIKLKELKTVIEACAGLYLEASSSSPTATPGETVNLQLEVLNRNNAQIDLVGYDITTLSKPIPKNIALLSNQRYNFKEGLKLPPNSSYTTPYWLNKKTSLGMYHVNDQELIGLPETPRAITVKFMLRINDTPISFEKPLVYRYSRPDKGELYRPFEIVPKVSASLENKVYIFENSQPKTIKVVVKAEMANLKGIVKLAHPEGWSITPAQHNIEIKNKGDFKDLSFTVVPPKNQAEGLISPIVELNGKSYTDEIVEIDYPHIPFQTVLIPSESKIVRLNLKKSGENIGYIEGAGDVVPESLKAIGYKVTTIDPETITTNKLSRFDAVVLGIRAYNVVDALQFKQKYLLEYIKQGGNLIVQYNTSRGIKVDNIAPYKLNLSRDRVTNENAQVKILQPDHPVLNYPNSITSEDFKGWVQERGLYFPDEWSNEFTALLSCQDPNESPKQGSLLIAPYGKGNYIYTGLSFFREFPAGVTGAYRLFANLLSAQSN